MQTASALRTTICWRYCRFASKFVPHCEHSAEHCLSFKPFRFCSGVVYFPSLTVCANRDPHGTNFVGASWDLSLRIQSILFAKFAYSWTETGFHSIFNSAGVVLGLPLLVESVMHVILDRRAKSPEAVVSDNILAEVISQGRHRWKIQRKAGCFQAIVWECLSVAWL